MDGTEAGAALVEALVAVGAIQQETPPQEGRLELANGRSLRVAVHPVSVARPAWARQLVANLRGRSVPVVVADQVPRTTREILDDAGWGWFDRRGHLKLHHGSVWIDADVPPAPRRVVPPAPDPLAGSVAVGVALAALESHPRPLAGIRPTARELGASPAAVSMAAARLVEAGMLTRDRRAVVPELFWAVVDAWRPRWLGLASRPNGELEGVVVVGTRAAAALGAPVALTRDYPVELLVADQAAARRVLRFLGEAHLGAAPVRFALAPCTIATGGATGPRVARQPVASPVVVALSLAGDRARGAEVLDSWDHPARVW